VPVAVSRPPQPGIPAALGPRPVGGSTMSPISAGSGASDQEKVNYVLFMHVRLLRKLGQQQCNLRIFSPIYKFISLYL
jgi:hypothetical protein